MFAENIGIGRTAIVGYEKGKFKPSPAVVAKIKEVYGVGITVSAEDETPAVM
ncbi:MAG: helix-turn-helix transcriptional regulator [Clostridia bacterium]|nr:helix-turn-helix transcriptional regulator [Clostridia bacterium]